MRSRTLLASALPALPAAMLAGALLLAGSAAQAQGGRVMITKMFIESCEEMGNCELRLTCQTGTDKSAAEMIPSAVATNPQTLQINKALPLSNFPVKVTCTLYEDNGWFGVSWDEVATASIDLEGGGNYAMKLVNPERAKVEVSLVADSFRAFAAPVAPVKPDAKPGAKPAAGPSVRFLGVFEKDADPMGHAVILGLDQAAFVAESKKLAEQSIHPTDIETWTEGGKRLWGGIFRNGPDASLLVLDLDGDAFLKRWTTLNNDEEMRLIDLEVYQDGGKRKFSGAFRSGSEESSFWVGQDRDAFRSKWQQLANAGLRLVDVEVYKGAGTKNVYAGVFLNAEGSHGMWNAVPWDKFMERWRSAGGAGLVDIESYVEDGKRLYDGVVLGGGGKEEVLPPTPAAALSAKWNEMLANGFRLTHFEAEQ